MEEINKLLNQYVIGAKRNAAMPFKMVLVGKLSPAITRALGYGADEVYLTPRALKHMYDKRSGENPDKFVFMLAHLKEIITSPDKVFKNKPRKRATHVIVKRIGEYDYLCLLEVGNKHFEIATCFPISNKAYLAGYSLLWG